ncbi:MAG: hypothetical protein ACRC5T_11440, partial [Cetobacterium sp.]
MIEPIINSFCVKYVTLDKEVNSNITNGSEINIYINLESVFQYFYTKIFVEYVDKNVRPSNEYCVAPLL